MHLLRKEADEVDFQLLLACVVVLVLARPLDVVVVGDRDALGVVDELVAHVAVVVDVVAEVVDLDIHLLIEGGEVLILVPGTLSHQGAFLELAGHPDREVCEVDDDRLLAVEPLVDHADRSSLAILPSLHLQDQSVEEDAPVQVKDLLVLQAVVEFRRILLVEEVVH